METEQPLSLEAMCHEVVALSKTVRRFVQAEALIFNNSNIEHKGKNDLVSYVDKETEQLLTKGLSRILPEAGFITEEETIAREDKDYIWVIDPIDGTTNFLHRLPIYSISIALLHKGELVLGVVHELNLGECFYAWKGGGAYCNGNIINCSPTESLDQSLIATGFPYSLLDKTDSYFEIIKDFVKTTHGVRRLGSAAVDLVYVAAGRFEGYFEFNLKIWDVAAGILIVKEAGGKVTDFSGGNDYLYGKELLAAGKIHAEMLNKINHYWK